MPFYIENIDKKSNFKKYTWFIGQEIKIIGFSEEGRNKNNLFSRLSFINPNIIHSSSISIHGVKLRWEDYPSEECRIGVLNHIEP